AVAIPRARSTRLCGRGLERGQRELTEFEDGGIAAEDEMIRAEEGRGLCHVRAVGTEPQRGHAGSVEARVELAGRGELRHGEGRARADWGGADDRYGAVVADGQSVRGTRGPEIREADAGASEGGIQLTIDGEARDQHLRHVAARPGDHQLAIRLLGEPGGDGR